MTEREEEKYRGEMWEIDKERKIAKEKGSSKARKTKKDTIKIEKEKIMDKHRLRVYINMCFRYREREKE